MYHWTDLRPYVNGFARVLITDSFNKKGEFKLTDLQEGAFENGALSGGYGRWMHGGSTQVGFWKTGALYGKGIDYLNGREKKCGLWSVNDEKFTSKEDISQFITNEVSE